MVYKLYFLIFQAKIWDRTLSLASQEESKSSLNMEPTLFGERHSPQQNATVSNIDVGNVSLGKVMRSLCKGIILNLHR